jgi:multidrug efflux pump subunit AcrA (membrane-fusion protein)
VTAASCQDTGAGIGIGSAGRADVVELVDAPATVTAKAVATLTAPADGTVVALPVPAGGTVVVGQVVAVIDSPSATARLDQATAALAALNTGGAGIARTNLAGVQRSTDEAAAKAFASARDATNQITDVAVRAALLIQLDAVQRSYEEVAASSRALVNGVQRGLASINQAVNALTAAQRVQAQAAYDLARSAVDALTLRAPVAGVVQFGGVATGGGPSLTDLLGGASGLTSGGLAGGGSGGGSSTGGAAAGPGVDPAAAVGGRVGPGTPVVTVVDTSELGLLADVDETDVLLVKPGITASVELDAAPGKRYDATVRSIDVLPSASARGGVSYHVRLALGAGRDGAETAPIPRPGMNAVAHLAVRTVAGAVTVPAAAVFSSDGRDTVWVVRAGKAIRVPVEVGVSGQDRIQVVSGVADGDRVVIRGADRVRAGQPLP